MIIFIPIIFRNIKIMYRLFFLLFLVNCSFAQITNYVNPFIGTLNGGNTFPGAVVPWGMVSLSPQNCFGCPSGYLYGEKYFYGLGHTHLSGTGCADLGGIIFTVTTGSVKTNPEQYRQSYSNEIAEPGFYKVTLDSGNITLEGTVTTRSSFIKIISQKDQKINILTDAGRSLSITGGGEVRILSDSAQEGFNISGGFCGEENRQKVYFFSLLSKPCVENGTWINNKIGSAKETAVVDSSIGSWQVISLSKGQEVYIKTGISYTSTTNAKLNLESEIPGWDFEKIKREARKSWEDVLSRIKIEDSSDSNKVIFYTALYHSLIHPNIISDVNGDYPLMGRKGTGNYKNRNRYSVFSLWDTYRTLHPFLTLVYPERESEIVRTMLDMAKENGYLPKWELAGNETYMMVGAPADIVIADTYLKGVKDFNADTALFYMMKPALLRDKEKAPPVRAGYHEQLQYGYIPFEQDWSEDWWVWGPVSTALEYCFSDFALAGLSRALNNSSEYNLFSKRSLFYKNLFDDSTQFFRPRSKKGNFITPFDSLANEGSGDWAGSGGPGYVEGNARDYAFYIPFDVQGMIKLYGGESGFFNKINFYFDQNLFSLNNEPEMFYPYLFTYISGKESKTRQLISSIIEKSFSTGADGLPGNDDCGAMSAWYLFSSMGFYPVCLASDEYRLGISEFDRVEIKLNQKYYAGEKIIIETDNNPANTGKIILNGLKLNDFKVSHTKLVSGAYIIFNK